MFISNVHHKYIKKRAKERMVAAATTASANDSSNLFWNSPDYFKLFEATNYNISLGNDSTNFNYMDANGGGGSSNGIGNNTVYTSTQTNQTFQYLMDGGANSNDSARQTFDTGSSFMLLLEDFGEYFYNYNGSGGGNVSSANVSFEFPTNCSGANATCGGEEAGKLAAHVIVSLARFFITTRFNHV